MLWAAAHRLDRRPHVPALRQEIPACRDELLTREATTVVNALGLSCEAVGNDVRPDQVPVAPHDGVGCSLARCLVWEQRRVNTAEDHVRAAPPDLPADLIPTERVASVDANADDIPRSDRAEIDRVQGFVDDVRFTPTVARRPSQDIQPTRRNDGDSERRGARVNQMNAWHRAPSQSTWSELDAAVSAQRTIFRSANSCCAVTAIFSEGGTRGVHPRRN